MCGFAVVREPTRGEITRRLLDWNTGDEAAAPEVFAALHGELHYLAVRTLSRERANHTLGSSGLVGEAFVRMRQQRPAWQSREHFMATVAQMMRRILIDYSRHRGAAKRGHGAPALDLADALFVASDATAELLAIHDALQALAEVDLMLSEIVTLRFFGGMTHEEIAHYLQVSLPTVERRWRVARAWLYRELRGQR